jgi:hypothetical protein
VTTRELIEQLREDAEAQAGLYGIDMEEVLDQTPVYAANTVAGEGGISWFAVVGLMDVHAPGDVPGVIVELEPRGFSGS